MSAIEHHNDPIIIVDGYAFEWDTFWCDACKTVDFEATKRNKGPHGAMGIHAECTGCGAEMHGMSTTPVKTVTTRYGLEDQIDDDEMMRDLLPDDSDLASSRWKADVNLDTEGELADCIWRVPERTDDAVVFRCGKASEEAAGEWAVGVISSDDPEPIWMETYADLTTALTELDDRAEDWVGEDKTDAQ